MNEKPAHLPDRLELGHVRLQKQAINRTAGQRDVVTQQGGIIGHGVTLLVCNNPRRLHQRGTSLEVPCPSGLPRRYEVARYALAWKDRQSGCLCCDTELVKERLHSTLELIVVAVGCCPGCRLGRA